MNTKKLDLEIFECQTSELSPADRQLVELAKNATHKSYAPYSHFQVGAAVRLACGIEIEGCNQENAAFPAGICAERAALFAAGAQHPEEAVEAIAIAARDATGQFTEEPVSPCGTCRQVLIETETRFNRPIRIILYGSRCIYVMEGIKNLMPLSFSQF